MNRPLFFGQNRWIKPSPGKQKNNNSEKTEGQRTSIWIEKWLTGWWFGTCFIFPYIGNNITTPLKMEFGGGHLMEFHFPSPPPPPTPPTPPPSPPSPPWLKIFEKWNGKTSGFQRSEIISGKFDHHDWPFIRAYSVVTPPTLWAKNDKGKHDLDQAGTGEFFIGATNSQTYQNIPNPAKSHHQIELLPSSLKRKGLKWIDFTNGI